MLNNIFKEWITSLLAILTLIACFLCVFLGKASLNEASAFIGGAFLLLFSKDSMIKKHKNKTPLVLLMILPMFTSCRSYKEYTNTSEIITIDTLTTTDTIPIYIYIPGDTVYAKGDTIIIDSTIYIDLSNGILTLPPWEAKTLFGEAQAGITNNVPWLKLELYPKEIDTTAYVERIKILEQKIKTTEKQFEKKKPFYKNAWFWIVVVIVIVKAKKNE